MKAKTARLAEVRLRPNPSVVECLENALEMARRGEVRSVAIAMRLDGRGDGGSCYALDEKEAIGSILGSLEYLKLRIAGAVQDEEGQ